MGQRPLSEQEFNAVVQRVMSSAPDGLDEASFNALLDTEVSKAESAPASIQPAVSHGPQPKTRDEQLFENFPYLKQHIVDDPVGTGSGLMMPGATAGKAAVGLGTKLARRIYSGLLKPKQGLKDSFGGAQEIAGTLLEQRAPITRGGLEKVTRRLGDSRNAAMDMVKSAQQQGTRGVSGKDVVSEFGDVVKELRKRIDIGQADELGKVGERGKAILRTSRRAGGDIPLTKAQAMKETAQDASSGAYRALERGGQKQLSADDLLDTATARALRTGIERRVPGVGAQNAKTQTLIGGRRALEDAMEREGNTLGIGGAKDTLAMLAGGGAYAAGAGPAAIPLAVGTRLMTTPSTGSMGAIVLNEASKSGILDAATRAAMIAMMRGQQE